MKKAKVNSPATIQDVRNIVNHAIITDVKELIEQVISTMNAMFEIHEKRLSKLEAGQTRLEEGQSRLEKGQTRLEEGQKKIDEIQKNQKKQLEISLQVVDELKAMREEQAAQANHNAKTNDTLRDHGRRIISLEQNFTLI